MLITKKMLIALTLVGALVGAGIGMLISKGSSWGWILLSAAVIGLVVGIVLVLVRRRRAGRMQIEEEPEGDAANHPVPPGQPGPPNQPAPPAPTIVQETELPRRRGRSRSGLVVAAIIIAVLALAYFVMSRYEGSYDARNWFGGSGTVTAEKAGTGQQRTAQGKEAARKTDDQSAAGTQQGQQSVEDIVRKVMQEMKTSDDPSKKTDDGTAATGTTKPLLNGAGQLTVKGDTLEVVITAPGTYRICATTDAVTDNPESCNCLPGSVERTLQPGMSPVTFTSLPKEPFALVAKNMTTGCSTVVRFGAHQ